MHLLLCAVILAMLSIARGLFIATRIHNQLPRTVVTSVTRTYRLSCAVLSESPAPTDQLTDLSKLEIRVGKIVEVGTHPEAENLYVEKVDVGEPSGPRTIVSGLVQYCSKEYLMDRKVIVLCNLKPRALKGVMSAGMLLCSSNAEHSQVVPILPPEGAEVGELIRFAGHKAEPIEAGNKASKVYSKIEADFFVNENGEATYKGIPFTTSQGVVTSTIKGKIS